MDDGIEPITHLEGVIAGEIEPMTHLEEIVKKYGEGGTSNYEQLTNLPKINGVTLVGNKTIYDLDSDVLSKDDVKNSLDSTSTDTPLSANMGKELNTKISNLKNIGRFLAIWDASTGTPTTEPLEMPYYYKTGDYFRIGVAGYKVPTGSEYHSGEYDLVEEETDIGDVWYYDGVEWVKQVSSGGGTVQDVQVNGTSVLAGGIANVPVGNSSDLGVFKTSGSYGIKSSDGVLQIEKATNGGIDLKSSNFFPIVPGNLDYAIEKGLGNNSLTWTTAEQISATGTIGAVRTIVLSQAEYDALTEYADNTNYQIIE